MDYNKYYEARDIVSEIVRKDILGPLDENEIIDEFPISYYITGKLYPQDSKSGNENDIVEDDLDKLEEDRSISLDSGKNPSSIGLTICLNACVKELIFEVEAALYEKIEQKKDDDEPSIQWKRNSIYSDIVRIDISELYQKKRLCRTIHEGLDIIVVLHKVYTDKSASVAIVLINTNKQTATSSRQWVNQHTYFQPLIRITGNASDFLDVRQNVRFNKNYEALEMEMLYSKHENLATGHGCAAQVVKDNGKIQISTEFVPMYELTQMMPSQNSSSAILSMKHIASLSKNDLIRELKAWIDEYRIWIDNNYNKVDLLRENFIDCAKNNLSKCKETYNTIEASIQCINDENVYKAFVYANEAMLNQRLQTMKAKGIKINDSEIRWYPFQLAFILQEIISFADVHSKQRKLVDLLWFPTGGGKTEAYLGIAAFVIFLRRLRNRDLGNGVAIIMRYTLRLLTFQQFERASIMICACENLRKKYNIPGGEISIGLWAGKALTPNTIEMADKILQGAKDPDNESSNPRQMEKCPWCGQSLDENSYLCDKAKKRMIIRCKNSKCQFSKGLPIYLIDEEIYTYTPTFLIATVDKFAQVPLKDASFSIFGRDARNLPPELIIQDELHLISGPLGSITGIYEAAFKKMCMYNGVDAKIIASTATIKNAKEQINSLYCSDFRQFPPQGIDADDSFFAIKSTRNSKPARMYMGCMGTGTSSTTVMIRTMADLLYATRYLEMLDFDEKIIDSFWTMTSYFNTLRELGGAITRVVDNVQDRFGYLKEKKFKDYYPIVGGQNRYDSYIELTSREKSENIGRIIQNELLIPYTKDKVKLPYDFILASNMISVGIDIARLNDMLVVGQPHTTAEYIQATSRVGRETPGLVLVLYNYMRSRDKSHFEQFNQYHEAFYKYVEATSVTPFAERARDRALQTLYVTLCRFYIDSLRDNRSAGNFKIGLKGTEEISQYILNYVLKVDPDEYENVLEELQDIETEWDDKASKNDVLLYHKDQFSKEEALFSDDYDETNRFRVLNSMRSVETSVQVVTR